MEFTSWRDHRARNRSDEPVSPRGPEGPKVRSAADFLSNASPQTYFSLRSSGAYNLVSPIACVVQRLDKPGLPWGPTEMSETATDLGMVADSTWRPAHLRSSSSTSTVADPVHTQNDKQAICRGEGGLSEDCHDLVVRKDTESSKVVVEVGM